MHIQLLQQIANLKENKQMKSSIHPTKVSAKNMFLKSIMFVF